MKRPKAARRKKEREKEKRVFPFILFRTQEMAGVFLIEEKAAAAALRRDDLSLGRTKMNPIAGRQATLFCFLR